MIDTIEKMIQFNIDFLNRKTVDGFDHFAPPDPETDLIRDYLIRMNEKGFITTCSQPAGLFYDGHIKQRAYVSVVCDINKLPLFFKLPNDINKSIIYSTGIWCPYFPYEPITIVDGEEHTFTGAGAYMDCNETSEDILVHTFADKIDSALLEYLKKKYVVVLLFDTVWERKEYLFENFRKLI